MLRILLNLAHGLYTLRYRVTCARKKKQQQFWHFAFGNPSNNVATVEYGGRIAVNLVSEVASSPCRVLSRSHCPLVVWSQSSLPLIDLVTTKDCTLRACLHGGGGPQVGEVTCLGGVKK